MVNLTQRVTAYGFVCSVCFVLLYLFVLDLPQVPNSLIPPALFDFFGRAEVLCFNRLLCQRKRRYAVFYNDLCQRKRRCAVFYKDLRQRRFYSSSVHLPRGIIFIIGVYIIIGVRGLICFLIGVHFVLASCG